MANFDQYMAETGRQAELDALRRSGGYEAAKAAYESGSSGGFQSELNDYLGQVEQYSKELEQTARDNFDFITKFLDKQHKVALGTNDQELAKFYEDVANSLEERVGRIPFDFQRRTEREKENLQNELKQIADQKRRIMEQSDFEKQLEQEATQQAYNARGLLGSGIQKKQELQQDRARQLRLASQIEPLTEQERLAQIGSGRTLQDITTQARRDAQDFGLQQEQQREGAQMDLNQRLAEINRQKAAEERSIRSLLSQKEELNLLNA